MAFGQDEAMGLELEGRHALITGGGTGIGAAAAEHLNAVGATLSLLGRRIEPLKAVAEGLGGTPIECDVTDPERIRSAFDEARADNGSIDLLVVNAGICGAIAGPHTRYQTRVVWLAVLAAGVLEANHPIILPRFRRMFARATDCEVASAFRADIPICLSVLHKMRRLLGRLP